ncbi:MAG TPA: hypothetical protein DCL35_02625 [Candidatus Omnitrophica bacterium]|nr:hypothetical protein [Candidatus Omnitrophota bacterium]
MKNGKIVLLNPTAPENPPNYFGPPYGLSLIAASLLRQGRNVLAYDFAGIPLADSLESIKQIILTQRPSYAGIPIQSSTRGAVYSITETIKKTGLNIKIILGGPFTTTHYRLLLENFPVDYTVIGDGEKTVLELLECLDAGIEPIGIAGLALRKNNKILRSPDRMNESDLDKLPTPAFHLFEDFEKRINEQGPWHNNRDFTLGQRSTNVKNSLLLLSSRGCVYSCNFCPMSSVLKNKIRFHSPGYFVSMVEHFYKKYDIRDFTFGDNFFTLIRQRALSICDEIIRRGLRIRWNCMTRPDAVDLELLTKMRLAGCFEVSYGVESGSPKIQRATGKNLDLERTEEAFRHTGLARMRSILMLMVGNTKESEKTVDETLAYARRIRTDNVLVKQARVYPGTKIHSLYESWGGFKKGHYLGSDPEPPILARPGQEDKIKGLYSSVWPKTIAIHLRSACNNRCACCKQAAGPSKSLTRIKNELDLAYNRAETVIFCGGEPILHKNFSDVTAYASLIGIHHQQLYTNGRIFAYKTLAKKIASWHQIETIIIPFFGDTAMHDLTARVKGAFEQTINGIRNIRASCGQAKCLQANIIVDRRNIGTLRKLTGRLSTCGIDRFHFIYGADSKATIALDAKDMPPIKASARTLKNLVGDLAQKRKAATFEGWPLCLLGRLTIGAYEWHAPFDEVITLRPKIHLCREVRKKMKAKPSFCEGCGKSQACEGVWKSYLRHYGTADIRQ